MKKLLFLLAGCFWGLHLPAYAQTLNGIVLDRNSKTPIQGASVFFDGTSIYTVTDEQGHFTLPVKQKINTQLMVSHVAYRPLSFQYPYDNLSDTLLMQEKATNIQEVVVSVDIFSRKLKMNAFRRHFLGETLAGKSCKILNEDDIQLIYNVNNNTMYASSDNPIIVQNKYLGYTVSYNLQAFYTQYTRKTLSDNYMTRYHISGSSSFADDAPGDSTAIKRRDRTYERSYTSFFYDLVHGKITPEGKSSEFQVIGERSMAIPTGKLVDLRDSLGLHAVYLKPNSEIIFDSIAPDGRKIFGQMVVAFKKFVRSGITHFEPVFLLDDFGNFNLTSGIFFDGDMARQRVGDMLPRDYRPSRPIPSVRTGNEPLVDL